MKLVTFKAKDMVKLIEVDEHDQRPAYTLTVEEQIAVFILAILKSRGLDKPSNIETNERKVFYGLKGLREFAHCSHATAQKIKNTKLKGCYSQVGRKIIFDEAKVLVALKSK
jgi:Protein of unknown function (DUF3853)